MNFTIIGTFGSVRRKTGSNQHRRMHPVLRIGAGLLLALASIGCGTEKAGLTPLAWSAAPASLALTLRVPQALLTGAPKGHASIVSIPATVKTFALEIGEHGAPDFVAPPPFAVTAASGETQELTVANIPPGLRKRVDFFARSSSGSDLVTGEFFIDFFPGQLSSNDVALGVPGGSTSSTPPPAPSPFFDDEFDTFSGWTRVITPPFDATGDASMTVGSGFLETLSYGSGGSDVWRGPTYEKPLTNPIPPGTDFVLETPITDVVGSGYGTCVVELLDDSSNVLCEVLWTYNGGAPGGYNFFVSSGYPFVIFYAPPVGTIGLKRVGNLWTPFVRSTTVGSLTLALTATLTKVRVGMFIVPYLPQRDFRVDYVRVVAP